MVMPLGRPNLCVTAPVPCAYEDPVTKTSAISNVEMVLMLTGPAMLDRLRLEKRGVVASSRWCMHVQTEIEWSVPEQFLKSSFEMNMRSECARVNGTG